MASRIDNKEGKVREFVLIPSFRLSRFKGGDSRTEGESKSISPDVNRKRIESATDEGQTGTNQDKPQSDSVEEKKHPESDHDEHWVPDHDEHRAPDHNKHLSPSVIEGESASENTDSPPFSPPKTSSKPSNSSFTSAANGPVKRKRSSIMQRRLKLKQQWIVL